MNREVKSKNWHPQEEQILKEWGEIAGCFRYMHFSSFRHYKFLNMSFTLPIIVISTVTGTANFSQEVFPESWQFYVPLAIGGLNLIAAIATTVQQFLKISELMEGHRVSSINYGKFSRNIRLELALPADKRSHNGREMVSICRTEYDRLIEQSPNVPGFIIDEFANKFQTVHHPEIIEVREIETYKDTESIIAKKISTAATIFKKTLPKSKSFGVRTAPPRLNQTKNELEDLEQREMVSRNTIFNRVMDEIKNKEKKEDDEHLSDDDIDVDIESEWKGVPSVTERTAQLLSNADTASVDSAQDSGS